MSIVAEHAEDAAAAARFFARALTEISGLKPTTGVRVLDFGCGAGALVQSLVGLGYDCYGCDIVSTSAMMSDPKRIRQIEPSPYRLPFDDDTFDAVVSTTVLEHARNPEEYLPEIRRVLKAGGFALHIFPAKWYLPQEPHLHVPLANYFYPNCPTWWFALWALLGWRSPHHAELGWRQTVIVNRNYYDTGVYYLSTREHERWSRAVFGNCEWPMEFYISHADGGFARLCRKLPFRKFWGSVSREFRMAFLLQHKANSSAP